MNTCRSIFLNIGERIDRVELSIDLPVSHPHRNHKVWNGRATEGRDCFDLCYSRTNTPSSIRHRTERLVASWQSTLSCTEWGLFMLFYCPNGTKIRQQHLHSRCRKFIFIAMLVVYLSCRSPIFIFRCSAGGQRAICRCRGMHSIITRILSLSSTIFGYW